jgi:hypothetical protein
VRALVPVGEDGVGDRQLLEPVLGGGVAGIAIRVPAEREPPIGRLDLDVAGPAVDPQRLIVVGRQVS